MDDINQAQVESWMRLKSVVFLGQIQPWMLFTKCNLATNVNKEYFNSLFHCILTDVYFSFIVVR